MIVCFFLKLIWTDLIPSSIPLLNCGETLYYSLIPVSGSCYLNHNSICIYKYF